MIGQNIQDLMIEAIGDDVVTHCVLIIEVMTENGMDLRVCTSENLTPWQADGMIRMGSGIIADGTCWSTAVEEYEDE